MVAMVQRSGTTPVDLVLNGYRMSSETPFDRFLRGALLDHAVCDAIQFLQHLRCERSPVASDLHSFYINFDDELEDVWSIAASSRSLYDTVDASRLSKIVVP